MLETLDQRFDKVLEKHERDFLSAYWSHMLKIQSEMEHMKAQSEENDFKLKKDKWVSEL